MKLIKDTKKIAEVARKILGRRQAFASFRRMNRDRHNGASQRFLIGVYFGDSHLNAYQMRQWYEPLGVLNERWPVVIIARNIQGAELLLRESGLSVIYAPSVTHLEQVIATHPLKIIFYVNQNTRNFQMFRYGARWHVFINHGESDKTYMTTNQIKSYDFAFVAGQAARERLTKHVWNYDVATRTFEIGRPQTDFMKGQAPYPRDERISVLYAPTWEGDRPATAYGSVASHGERIARAVLASRKHRFIYRPHPRSGLEDSEYAAAHRNIVRAIREANRKDPLAHHVFDESAVVTWQISQTDIAICDISAMIYDRLATGKPVMVTRPANAEAVVDDLGYLQACEWLSAHDAAALLPELDRVLNDTESKERLAFWAEHYFGDITPGAPTARFVSAVATLMKRWEETDIEMRRRPVGEL